MKFLAAAWRRPATWVALTLLGLGGAISSHVVTTDGADLDAVHAGDTSLPTVNTSLFGTSGNCVNCHSSGAESVMIDSEGNDLTNAEAWRGTMMANAFRDPYYRARMEAEINRHPHLQEIIEDKCLSCHAPMGREQALFDGATTYSIASAEVDPLAQDGVSCTLCHQIQPTGLGTDASFSGGYEITSARTIFGPYEDINGGIMGSATGFNPAYGEHMNGSELCATCHTLFTPTVDDFGVIVGEFPEQTPYLEWLNSVYADGPEAADCQSCHMPVIDESIIISDNPPGLDGQSPFWQHHFVGGNAFMLRMIRDNGEALNVTADEVHFNTTIQRTLDQLARAASVEFHEVIADDPARVVLAVTNHTGHKFPTSYPERRAWIRLTARNASGDAIFDSGAWNASGEIVGLDPIYEPHHDVITASNQIQVYEVVMGDVNGQLTHTLLRAAERLKDNRLPPVGFVSDGASTEFTSVTGLAASDENFNIANSTEGSGTDLVTFEIPIGSVDGPITLEAMLVYQSVPPRAVADLLTETTPMVASFEAMYLASDNTPVEVVSRTETLVLDVAAGVVAW